MTQIPASAFSLNWRQTWDDKPDDYVARTDSVFCRIYHQMGGPQRNRWFWTCARVKQLGSGHADSARQAALAAETLYLRPDN